MFSRKKTQRYKEEKKFEIDFFSRDFEEDPYT